MNICSYNDETNFEEGHEKCIGEQVEGYSPMRCPKHANTNCFIGYSSNQVIPDDHNSVSFEQIHRQGISIIKYNLITTPITISTYTRRVPI